MIAGRWPKDNQDELVAFYGMPKTKELEQQLVDVLPPFKMYYEGKGKPIKSFKFHAKAAEALQAALNEIWEHVGHDQAELDRLGVSCFDGAYNPRFVRGSTSKWSNHAYGAAIDINSTHNAQGMGRGNMPEFVIDAFKRQEARWGGDYKHSKTDPMHFEFCDAGEVAVVPEPTVKPAPSSVRQGVQVNIVATEFGDESELQEGAYGGMIDPDVPGVALPFHFSGDRKRVKVTCRAKSVIADIVDVGPHNIDDPYWETGARPLAEKQYKEGIKDFKGREVTNSAGIDLTPAVFDGLAIPGKRGMRGALVTWEFTTLPTKASASSPMAAVNQDEVIQGTGVEVEVVQRRLKELGYHEVGPPDGKWAGKTASAIAAFKNDRHLTGPAIIDQELKDELDVAEQGGFKRPIATERATAPEEVVEVKAPELAPVKQNRFVAFWGSVVAAFGALADWLGDRYKDVLGWFNDIREYLGLIPKFVWFMIAAVVLIYFWKNSQKGAAGIVKSFQTGERN